jgi:preprotein translocase subunit SecF
MGTRKLWYTASAIMIVISIGSFVTRGLNLAVDFTGGVTAEVHFAAQPDLDRVRAELARQGFSEPQAQTFGTSRDVLVRLPPQDKQSASEVRARVDRAVKAVSNEAEIKRVEVVGPQVGAELRNSSIWALIATVILIFIYVALRFHTLRLGLGAILAALHDPILVLGFFSVTQMTFDLAVVAAVLAVIGYSLNDTVVVFDRIRERFEANRRSSPSEVLDESVNSTLSRTVMTAVTTLIVVTVLYVLGGAALEGFSAAIIVGILVGTYSSIYIAAAIALREQMFGLQAQIERDRKALDDMP